jgi:nucleotide-binding universal stress UspA family protein
MARTILAPFDGSALAAGALPCAAALAGAGGTLVFLRVVGEPAAATASGRALRQTATHLRRRMQTGILGSSAKHCAPSV